jgi:hypothetical protein
VLVAVEGGALDLVLLTPPEARLAVVAIGRDPGLPWPVGCAGGE